MFVLRNLQQVNNASEAFRNFGRVGLPLVSDRVSPFRAPTDTRGGTKEVKYCVNLVRESSETEPTAIPSVLLQKVCLLHAGANVTGFTYCIEPKDLDPELQDMFLGDLKRKAHSMGVGEATAEQADDQPDPKEYLLSHLRSPDDIDYEDDSWLSYFAHDTSLGRLFPEWFQRHGYKQRGVEDVNTHRYARVYTHNRHLATMVSLLLNLASEMLEIQAAFAFIRILPGWSGDNQLKYALNPASFFVTSYALCLVVRLAAAFSWARAHWRRDMHPAAGGQSRIRGDLITHSFEPLPTSGQRKCRIGDQIQKYDLCEQVLCCSYFSQFGRSRREEDHPVFPGFIEKQGYAHLSCDSMWRLKLQYLIFELLAVPKDAMYLHLNLSPFSHIQQWCAFQKDGARATIITYPFRGFWLHENLASNNASYVAKGLSSLVQTVVRMWTFVLLFRTVWPGGWGHKVAILYSFVPSIWRFIAAFSRIRKLYKAKKLVMSFLETIMTDPECTELMQTAAKNMWELYGFGPPPTGQVGQDVPLRNTGDTRTPVVNPPEPLLTGIEALSTGPPHRQVAQDEGTVAQDGQYQGTGCEALSARAEDTNAPWGGTGCEAPSTGPPHRQVAQDESTVAQDGQYQGTGCEAPSAQAEDTNAPGGGTGCEAPSTGPPHRQVAQDEGTVAQDGQYQGTGCESPTTFFTPRLHIAQDEGTVAEDREYQGTGCEPP